MASETNESPLSDSSCRESREDQLGPAPAAAGGGIELTPCEPAGAASANAAATTTSDGRPTPQQLPGLGVSVADSVTVPRLALHQLQAAPAVSTTLELNESLPKQQGSVDDNDPLVEFNVGGSHYVTSMSTLATVPGSAFAPILQDHQARGRLPRREDEGSDAIATFDRDGPSFRWVLIYLRWAAAGCAPPLALPQDAGERHQLAEEAAFYGLPELEEHCRRPRLSQFELTQLLGALPLGNDGRVDLRGCDLSGLHLPFHTFDRAELGGAYIGGSVMDATCRTRLEVLSEGQRPIGLESVRWIGEVMTTLG